MVPDSLSPSQVAAFHRDGYLILRNALDSATVVALLAETQRLLSTLSLSDHPMTRFTTGTSDAGHVGDDYFLTSGDSVRFFFEEDAFDADGKLAVADPRMAVNKMGHGLHRQSPPFAALSSSSSSSSSSSCSSSASSPSPPAIARALGFRDPRVLQSMVICKHPRLGGAVAPHQDSSFLYTTPPSALGFWYALEDAGRDNGCLWFLPGSHRWAPIAKRLVRKPGGTDMVDNHGPRFPGVGGPDPGPDPDPDPDAVYVPGEVCAGDLVLIHGNLLHKSEKNTSEKGRIIYTFHIIEAEGTTYDERNWLQPSQEGFTKLYHPEHRTAHG
ncbi:hypothetical protein XA68_10277 [Ophiocordyceps unilateralis]|uniref:Fe2OG dioxygenase domain-containing protein n=1 Tax=Ophiocordyceps unilateralis TaxID=268505 RepID=A0A2A9PJ15_OPHUN|nr:hypothetical protein XA68_10277 [Ophiocordyceps unilateralis]